MKNLVVVGVAVALALLVVVGIVTLTDQSSRVPALPPGADFVLQSADGPVDSRSYRGKVLLIYFGYSNCPDVCPASLTAGGQALKALSAAERQRVKMFMVSVDPERDSVQHLKKYTAFFHAELTGITGDPAQIASLAQAFGAGYIKQPAAADGRYAIDHTVSTYVVDPDGKLAAVLDLGVSTDKLVSTIRKLL